MIRNLFKILVYFISFIAFGAIAAFLVFKVINFDKSGEVPVLEGKSVTEAAEDLNKRKLSIR